MQFLSAAGAGIVKTVVEYFVEPVVQHVKYLTRSKGKLLMLKTSVEDLIAAREGLKHDVDPAVRNGERVQDDVELWQTRVDEITVKANKCLQDEGNAKTKCLYGLCPNVILRYKLGRKSTKLRDKILVKLDARKNFPSLTYSITPQDVCSISTRENTSSDSRISTLKEILYELKNPNADMILVCGIGGVGKTTLAEEVLRKAIEDKLFDDVVMVRDVKKNPDLGRVQKEIATKLGMEALENQTLSERAPFLCDRLKDKKTLVILDDVWEALDLVAMGIPHLVTCKILLTSRGRRVFSLDFREQKVFPLDILGEEDSWSLFEERVGDIVKKDHRIRNIAIQIAKRCGGLPLLLVTVARSLKYRTILQPWKHTLRQLKDIADEGLTKKAYLALEWSYNQLDEHELKPFFLLCATILFHNSVDLSDLLKYGMGLGLLKNDETIEEAQNTLYSFVEKLKDFGLLLDGNDHTCVRMHDLVREVALSIAARDAHALSVTGELKEWPEIFGKCSSISLLHCDNPRLPEVLQYPELEMFYLRSRSDDVRLEFPYNFFKEVIKLKVLDLTGVSLTPSLPLSLQVLKNLRTLCLDSCELGDISMVGKLGSLEILSFQYSDVKCLPKEIGQLTRLRLLDLTNCLDLEVISPNVISSLEMLEDLRMRNSFTKWEDDRVVGERRNASLSELKYLSHLTALQLHIPRTNSHLADLFSNKSLERYHICIGDSEVWKDMVHETSMLNTLILKASIINDMNIGHQMLLQKSEVLCLDGTEGTDEGGLLQQTHFHVINSKVQLSNLNTLKVDRCDGKFLLSSSTARSLIQLKHLRILGCPLLEGIISRKQPDEENDTDIMFPKLEHLELRNLPNLARFFSGDSVETPSIQILELVDCAEVGTLDSEKNLSLDEKISVSLFDPKVRLPSLKRLYIFGLPKLITIWHHRLPLDCDFQNLKSVEISFCGSLRYVFPASLVLRGLQQLEKLQVWSCHEMEAIIAKEEGLESIPLEFVFPKVTSMKFEELPKVSYFYPGTHAFEVPLLKHLIIIDVGTEENHEYHRSSTLDCSLSLGLFSIHKDSFPYLESLELCGGKIWSEVVAAPAGLFSNLKSICFYGWSPFSSQDSAALLFLEKLPNLEEIEERRDAFVSNGNGSGVHVLLPRVTTLKLCFLFRLMNVGGNHNSQPATDPVLPNLETLIVNNCSRLKSLESSAISFCNLTSLEVVDCREMKYLITYDIAKRLEQLTTMEVGGCEVMTEIIRISSNLNDNSEDDDACEIAFKRLQHLTLRQLPKLEKMCSGRNCTVEFPSLKSLYISECLVNKLKIVSHHDETLQIIELVD